MLSALLGLGAFAPPSQASDLYSLDQALEKGVVNARIDIFNATDKQHALAALADIKPGMIYSTFVGPWGELRQRDIDAAGLLATIVRRELPRTILGGGINESLDVNAGTQTLSCGGTVGTRSFAPGDMVDRKHRPLAGTAWLDLANPVTHDYMVCIGTMLIDRGFTVIGFAEHSNTIAHSSSRPDAVRNLVDVMTILRRYGKSKGEDIHFSGDPSTDETRQYIDLLYIPARFFHTTFAQQYQNKVVRPGIGVGYSYALSAARVHDVMSGLPKHQKAFFYVDNWDANQDDLRRFMELDAANRRFLLERSAAAAHALGAYFIPNLLHCTNCIPAKAVGDPCEIRDDGKTEYDAVTCGDVPTIKRVLAIQH